MCGPSVDEWLPEDHRARFVIDVVEQLDLSALTRRYTGRESKAHHPAVLLGLLVYGYATGVFSSRKIEACRAHDLTPLVAMKREVHHLPFFECFAARAREGQWQMDAGDPGLEYGDSLGISIGLDELLQGAGRALKYCLPANLAFIDFAHYRD